MGFTTGSHAAGYTLADIEFRFDTVATPAGVSVKLATGLPSAITEVATLTNPATLAKGINKFTAPANTTLSASTTYFVVVEGTAGQPRGTSSNSEDGGAAAGWSVGDETYHRMASSNGSFSTSTNALMIRVNGSARPAPEFVSAEVDGTKLSMEFSENLKGTSVPAHGDFNVTVAGSRRNVTSGGVAIADKKVTLTLASAVTVGQTVAVRYTKPSSNPLQSAGGADVATFADQPVTNKTAPVITGIAIVSKPRNVETVSGNPLPTYGRPQPIVVEVTWNGPVSWDLNADNAELRFRLQIGSSNKTAQLVTDGAKSGTASTLWFSYAVKSGDTDTDGVAVVPTTSGTNKDRVVFTHSGATLKGAAGTDAADSDAGTTFAAGLSAQSGHRVKGSISAAGNSTPTYEGTHDARRNAPPGTLVFFPGILGNFSDADTDNLRFTTSATRRDALSTFQFAGTNWVVGTAEDCVLEDLTPALPLNAADRFENTVTLTATDPDGASVTAESVMVTAWTCREFVSASVNGNSLTLTYDESLPSGNAPWRRGLARDQFTVKVDGDTVELAQTSPISVSGSTLTLNLAQAVARNKAVTVSYAPSVAAVRGLIEQPVTNVNDTVPESASITGSTMTVTFSRNLKLPGADADERAAALSNLHWAFSATGLHWSKNGNGGVPLGRVHAESVSSVSGKTVTLDFGDVVAGKQVAVSYSSGIAEGFGSGLLDIDGSSSSRVPSVSHHSVTSTTDRPLVVSGQVAGTELTLTFDSDLDASSAPAGSRFAVTAHPVEDYVSGDSVDPNDPTTWHKPARNIKGTGTATVSGKTVTVTLAAAVDEHDTAVASYWAGDDAKPLRAASAGAEVHDIWGTLIEVHDRTPPEVVDSVVARTTLVLYYGEWLDTGSEPATGAFSVTVAGSAATVTDVAMSKDAVTLTLGSSVTSTQAVSVSYTAPSTSPVQDLAGNDAASFSGRSITNPGPTDPGAPSLAATSPAVADQLVLTLAFDRALDPARVPGVDAFTLKSSVDGTARGLRILEVAVRGSKVELRISPGFAACSEDYTVSYTKPSENALRNVWGTDAAAFSDQAVTNVHAGKCRHFGSRIIPVVTIPGTNGGVQGSSVSEMNMMFKRSMSLLRTPSPDGFSVTSRTPRGAQAPPVAVESTDFSSDGTQLQLSLSRLLDPGEQVTVSYRHPHTGPGLRDGDGNLIAPFSARTVVLGAAPTVTGVEVVSDAGDDDTYAMGEVISFRVTFSGPVDVTGAPTLGIDMDPADWGRKDAVYASGSGTTELIFTHAVIEPNYSSQGIAVLADTLALNGGTITAVAGGTDAELAHTGLGHDPDHKVDWQQSPPDANGNRAPVFGGASADHDNALPGYLVTLTLSKDDFSDPDGDPLTFTLSASRDDVHVPDGYGYIEGYGRIWYQAKTACALAGLAPPTGDAYDTVITLTATDPDGASAHATATFRTNPTEFACPSMSSAAVDGDTLTITLAADGALPPSFEQPTADEFEVKADGAAVSLADSDAVSASDTVIVLTLASPVTAGQAVTVSYTPGDDPMAAAFTDQAVTNNTPAPPDDSEAPKKPSAADEQAIVPTGATVSGNELTLTFGRDLAAVDDAAAGALRWVFLVDGAYHHGIPVTNQSPSRVVVEGATVTLTLGTAISPGDDVTVTYFGGLQEADGTAIEAFTAAMTTAAQD